MKTLLISFLVLFSFSIKAQVYIRDINNNKILVYTTKQVDKLVSDSTAALRRDLLSKSVYNVDKKEFFYGVNQFYKFRDTTFFNMKLDLRVSTIEKSNTLYIKPNPNTKLPFIIGDTLNF